MSRLKAFLKLTRIYWLEGLAAIVLLAAFAGAMWVGFGVRMPVEARNRTVGLLVDYDQLKRISDGSHNIELNDMFRKAKLAGATGLIIRERILADWEIAGDLVSYTGNQLLFQMEAMRNEFGGQLISDLTILPENTYILTKDSEIHEQIFSMLEAKRRYPEAFRLGDYLGITATLHSSERSNLGLGFPLEQLREAEAYGFKIFPQLRNWEPVREDSVETVFGWVAKIPNLAAIGFNERNIVGDSTIPLDFSLPHYRAYIDYLEAAIRPLDVPLVSFEFYEQFGLTALAGRLDYDLIRAHAIPEEEMSGYTGYAGAKRALDRYSLAVRERNIRYIYIRFSGLLNPAAAMEPNLQLVTDVRDMLIDDGFIIGEPTTLNVREIPFAIMFLLGAGVLTAGGWILALTLGRFFGRKWRLPYAVLMILGIAAFAGMLMVMPLYARKLAALAGAVVFPSLAIVWVVEFFRKRSPDKHCLPRAAAQFIIISAMTLMGALIMSSLLTETRFMLALDGFMGVTIANLFPLVIVPFVMWFREKDSYALVSDTLRTNVRVWQMGLCFVVVAALAMYVLRMGNDAPQLVSGVERAFRQLLDDVIGVRPRTAEFLIGHPLMLLFLFLGYHFKKLPLLMAGTLGQVSMMNTYEHIHTPLAISMQRSFHGLWLGLIIGIVLIGAYLLGALGLRKLATRV